MMDIDIIMRYLYKEIFRKYLYLKFEYTLPMFLWMKGVQTRDISPFRCRAGLL
jgi:hypothetical protein